jgi:hypothetical protein
VSQPRFPSYGFHGESESRVKLEFQELHKSKLDLPMKIFNAAPSVSTAAEGEPFLAKDGANWYIYIKVRGSYQRVALTAV